MKYHNFEKYFFLLKLSVLFAFILSGCSKSTYQNNKISTSYILVNDSIKSDKLIESFLNPYKNHIAADLSKILAYNPQNLDKTESKWQNAMTNFYADAILEIANPIFNSRTGKNIDLCLLNYGGIRSTIAKGNITTKTAFEIMPFENSAIVLELSGKSIQKMCDFIIQNKVAHPISGIKIIADSSNNSIKNIFINNKLLEPNTNYYLVTNDYLAKGGDKMLFLTDAEKSYNLDYKLRNMFIAYFTKIDTLNPSLTPRIIFE